MILQDAYHVGRVVFVGALFRHGVPYLHSGGFPCLGQDRLPPRCQRKHHCHGASQSAGKTRPPVYSTFWTCDYELLRKRKWDRFAQCVIVFCQIEGHTQVTLLRPAACCFRTVTGSRWTPVTLCSNRLMGRPSATKDWAPSSPLSSMRRPIMKNNRPL